MNMNLGLVCQHAWVRGGHPVDIPEAFLQWSTDSKALAKAGTWRITSFASTAAHLFIGRMVMLWSCWGAVFGRLIALSGARGDLASDAAIPWPVEDFPMQFTT